MKYLYLLLVLCFIGCQGKYNDTELTKEIQLSMNSEMRHDTILLGYYYGMSEKQLVLHNRRRHKGH